MVWPCCHFLVLLLVCMLCHRWEKYLNRVVEVQVRRVLCLLWVPHKALVIYPGVDAETQRVRCGVRNQLRRYNTRLVNIETVCRKISK